MSNIINIGGDTPAAQEKNNTPTYTLRYEGESGVTEVTTLKADVMMTNTYIGFIDDSEQKLLFAIPIDALIDITLVDDEGTSIAQ